METIIFIECGRKRRGEYANCKLCNNKFARRLKPVKGREKQVYCGSKCSRIASRTRIEVECYQCKNKFERVPNKIKSSKTGLHFCSRKCKEFAQSIEGGCEEIQPKHYNNGEHNYRAKCKDELKLGCIDCPVKELYKLTVHHIDGDRSNNDKSNLEVVCWNCHAKRHLQYIDGEWSFYQKCLTPREMLSKIS